MKKSKYCDRKKEKRIINTVTRVEKIKKKKKRQEGERDETLEKMKWVSNLCLFFCEMRMEIEKEAHKFRRK